MKCRCGCGTELPSISRATLYRIRQGKNSGYIRGHAQRSSHNNRWKGGASKAGKGYILIPMPGHPNARKSGYILEHRFIMSEYLGRPLSNSEIIHHMNGDITDNRIENPQIVTHHSHIRFHPQRGRKVPKRCPTCGKMFIKRLNHAKAIYCSRKCINLCGENHWKAKLTEGDVKAIRELEGTLSRTKIAREFGISASQVKKIHRRESWKHIK